MFLKPEYLYFYYIFLNVLVMGVHNQNFNQIGLKLPVLSILPLF